MKKRELKEMENRISPNLIAKIIAKKFVKMYNV